MDAGCSTHRCTADRCEGAAEIGTAEEFAHRLDVLRRRSGKSYRRLAEECGLGFNTVAGYCSGRHLPQLSVQGEFRRLLAALGVVEAVEQDRWWDEVGALRARAGRGVATPNPYRGLRPFRAEDAELFFGRVELTAEVLASVRRHRGPGIALVVVGPSGSGKSSLLRAGLLPAVGRAVLLTPGAEPLRQWADRAAELAGPDVTVVIDQFEELFTLCADEAERHAFLDLLTAHPGPVVLGLRSDFYDRALHHPQLTGPLRHAQLPVGPMTAEELRAVVLGPARAVGLELADGLVELVLRETAGQPGVLPLLSHTLRTVVALARRDAPGARAVGVAHYTAAGGVRGAVARTAEEVYRTLPPERRTLARHLFLRLVRTEEGTADTRRRVGSEELFEGRTARQADDLAEVVDLFVRHRLLSAGPGTVELGHEALLHAWPRLADWLAEDRAGHLVHGRLTAAARAWRDGGRSGEGLYRGAALATALEWAADPEHAAALNPLEGDFLAAAEQAEAAERAAERRRVGRGRRLVALLVVLALAAAGAGGYARQTAARADREAAASLSRQEAVRADRLRTTDPALAAQLAVAAHAVAGTPEARSALLDSTARPLPRRIRPPGGTPTALAAGGGLLAAGAEDGQIRVWHERAADGRAADGRVVPPDPLADGGPSGTGGPEGGGDWSVTVRPPGGGPVSALALSPDGTVLAVGDAAGRLSLWRTPGPAAAGPAAPGMPGTGTPGTGTPGTGMPATGTPVPAPFERVPFDPGPLGPDRITTLAFAPDGHRLAIGTAGAVVHLADLDGRRPAEVLTGALAAVKAVVFTPDGRVLAAGGDDTTVRLWAVPDGGPAAPLPTLTGPASRVFAVAVSPDGRTLAAGTAAEHTVHTWDITDPRHPVPSGPPLTGPASWVNALAFSPDGATLAAGSSDTLLWRWDLRTRRPLGTLPHPAPVGVVRYRDAHGLETLAGDGLLREWDIPGPELTGSTGQVFSVSFGADGSRLLVGAGDATLRLWELGAPDGPAAGPVITNSAGADGGSVAASAGSAGAPAGDGKGPAPLSGASALSADGRTAVAGATDGSVRLWDLRDPARPVPYGPALPVAGRTVQAVALEAGGSAAAVTSDDGSVHLLDLTDPARPEVTAALPGQDEVSFGVRFSPDGRLLAVAGGSGRAYLWDVADRRHPRALHTFTHSTTALYAVAFGPGGRLLALAGADSTVRLFDLTRPDAPQPVGPVLGGPVGEVYELAFSPTRPLLAVASTDRTVWLWDLTDPRHPVGTATLKAAEDGLLTVAFASDGHTLAAGGRDRAVRLWETDPGRAAARVCAAAGAPLAAAEWARLVPERPFTPPCR
ncbi:helix-turn-helix domain-containing protein [Kitasatospora sp. NPDC096147]|uniref:nSTAND1 domain-containing NTPase n=1 Tax=Kitasatospora sp. NPDC096147 TaxID=3364093 RepID=UPI00380D4A0F